MSNEVRRAQWKVRIENGDKAASARLAFAREHSLDIKRMGYWARSFTQHDKPKSLVAVAIKPVFSAMPTAQSALTLRSPSGWTVTLPPDLPAAWLSELLQCLRWA